jgi:titin
MFFRTAVSGVALGLSLLPAHAATLVVNTSDDVADVNGCDATHCSLREALGAAKVLPGGDTIAFHIPANDPNFAGGVFKIRPTVQLPSIWGENGNGTVIDGATQTAFTGNTNAAGPEVQINGSLAGLVHGIIIKSANCTIKGLNINGFAKSAIRITDPAAIGNKVQGCYIGTNAAGNGKDSNGAFGILLTEGSSGSIIGGAVPSKRNIISGNQGAGITIDFASTGNVIQGNYIGTNASGTAAIRNGALSIMSAGIVVRSGTNSIGSTISGSGNLISGNGRYGVLIAFNSTSNNSVRGNLIGTNASGTAAIPNGLAGVGLLYANTNSIGGTDPAARNLISGNARYGVLIAAGNGNSVQGNFIGTNATGSGSIANGYAGVGLTAIAQTHTIGGTVAGQRNVISGNSRYGVVIALPGTDSNKVLGNAIGISADGAAALSNGFAGVGITGGAQSNVIGGTTAEASNVISGNAAHGIVLTKPATKRNLLQGNLIGMDATGSKKMANGAAGIFIEGSSFNLIGGTATASNKIGFNGGDGVVVFRSGTGNKIRHNSIYKNGGLGINIQKPLEADHHVTSNDEGDGDLGPNRQQNSPFINSAISTTSSTAISGSLQSLANTKYVIEFFRNVERDWSGSGEGRNYLGKAAVTTDEAGKAIFTFNAKGDLAGFAITATATNSATGDTSEFSSYTVAISENDTGAPVSGKGL